MPVAGFDHVAITVADVDVSIDFYVSVLGAELLHGERWRTGEMPVALLQVGTSRLSVHPAAAPVSPHAQSPTPGSADLCFRYEGAVADILTTLEANRVPVEEGPVPRPASNGVRGTSVYFRDPDGNLLELLTLDG
ncbi:MAG TPA: VOC family protein [Acidimicrobiia bacterium]|nr:VOC family protein [Acidimicrobiia bacterium]